MTQNHTAAVEFAQNEQVRRTAGLQGGFDLPERAYTGESRERTATFWLTSASPTVLNELRARVSRNHLLDRAVTTTPAVLVLEAFNAGGNQDALFREDTTDRTRVSNVTTFARSTHSIRVGAQADVIRLAQVDRANFNGTFIFGSDVVRDGLGNPVAGVRGEPSVISGLDLYRLVRAGTPGYRPSQFSMVKGEPAVALSIVESAWFAQDDWRAAPRLTVSYGVRHEIQQYDGLRMRFAPRAGLAWAPTADGNSAVRAGVGVFYTPIPHRLFSDALRLDGRHGRQLVVDRPEFFPGVPSALPSVQDVTATIRTQSPDLTLPMMLVSTVSYDRRLVGSLFGSIGYTWRRGTDLLRTRNVGVSPEAGLTVPNALNLQFESTGRSTAHEVNATVSGNIGPDVTVFGSYGFTRAMQDTDDLYSIPADSANLAAEWGRAPVPAASRVVRRVDPAARRFRHLPVRHLDVGAAVQYHVRKRHQLRFGVHRPAVARPTRAGRCGCDTVRRLQSQPAAGRARYPAQLRHRTDELHLRRHRVQDVRRLQGPDALVASHDDSC